MSSLVNESDVSESKKQQQQQQQITEKEEENNKQTETTTTATNIIRPTTTLSSNNDNNQDKKHNNENTKTLNENENKSEKQCDNDETIKKTLKNNYVDDNNKSIINIVLDDVLHCVGHDGDDDDNNDVEDKNLNKTKDISTTITATTLGLPDGGCGDLLLTNMTPGSDVEQKQQQQVASFDTNQITHNKTTTTTSTVSELLTQPATVATSTASIISSSNSTGSNVEIKLETLTTSSANAYDGSVTNATSTSSSSPSTPTTPSSPLPPLPPGLSSNIVGSYHHHLPHICSEPTFGVQLRNRHMDRQTDTNCSANQGGIGLDWRPDTSAPNCSSVIKSGTVSASASPNMVRKTSDAAVLLPRRVSFPKSDNQLVTGYLEPANPWEHVCTVKSISEIAELYMTSCQKHNTKPLQCILDHLKAVDLTKQLRRQPLLSLKSIKLAPSDCEALEEVLKRVQYKAIDLSDCKLEEAAASALFEMIEYYEATNELDISANAIGMTHRGWISCTYMISHSQELQVLNAEGNPISKLSADNLGNALSTSNLHTLKLEHCGLKGAPLSGLCFKLWHNRVLKELWLAHNDLDCSDADTIAEMLKVNHYLELIDISNNNIRDEGLRHIVMALIMQSKELERRTTFQRTAAIDDDGESISPVETSPPIELGGADINDATMQTDWSKKVDSHDNQSLKNDNVDNESILCKDKPLATIDEKSKLVGGEIAGGIMSVSEQQQQQSQQHPHQKLTSVKPPLISSVGSTIDENDGDEDTEDTMRSSTIKITSQNSGGGQSMLDKLLSMNSESSSEDGASDTLAACCSEDASLMSDDIFDAAATTTTTTTSTNTKAPTTVMEMEIASLNDREGVTVTSAIFNEMTTMTSAAAATTSILLRNSPRATDLIDNQLTRDEATNLCLLEPLPPTSNMYNAAAVNILQSPHVNTNINNNNNNNNNNASQLLPLSDTQQTTATAPAFSNHPEDHKNLHPSRTSDVFEVTAEESDCLQSSGVDRILVGGGSDGANMQTVDQGHHQHHHAASRALDVNKNTKLGEDFDDTHSTDSAFESASEGDISRHLPEEFTRLSTSLESTRLDDISKELAIETATIASESNECLIAAAAHITPSSTPTPLTPPFAKLSTPLTDTERLAAESPLNAGLSTSLPSVANINSSPTTKLQIGFAALNEPTESPIVDHPVNDGRGDKLMPKVTIAQDSFTQKYKTNSAISTSPSLTPTPPPPSTSPGGASSGLRRTESSCTFLTQSSRNRSQSTDSLCSDNSLDGSIGSGDMNFSTSSSQLNEKIAKNDTLTRQQRPPLDAAPDVGTRTPGGLKALAVWNNNLTKEAGLYISDLLAETVSIELLNIGKNCLSNDFVTTIKESLTRNTTITTLGLQSAHLSAKGIETLSSILTFGGNCTLQRIDIRDNKLEVESLSKIAEVLKSNTTVTQIDIDDEPKRLSVGSEAHLDYARVLENVRSMCSRNEKTQAQILQEKTTANAMAKRRGGYYLGSRKISLTCHSRPVVDPSKNVVVAVAPNSKLDVKRKAGARLRSPVPSPTTVSPSSSPNRSSRFQVFRVCEVSPLTSPSTQKQIGGLGATKAVSSSSVAIPLSTESGGRGNDTIYPNITSTSLPTSCSLPSMATISSSTQSIKRLAVSPRSRFLVRKVYEDPNLPLASRSMPPITPPINPPPTPISRNAKDSLSMENLEATPPPPTTPTLTTAIQQQSNNRGAEELQQVFSHSSSTSSNSSSSSTITKLTPPLTAVVIPPTIQQQQVNTTTDDTTSTITENTPTTTTTTTMQQQQCEQSTNNTTKNTICDKQQITHLTTGTTTISTSCSNLQSSPSILSTLSTLSSSPSASDSSSTSTSSSTSPASNADSTDSSSSPSSTSSSSAAAVYSNEALLLQQQKQQKNQDLNSSSGGQCPIAVFGDNDITLTKNTVNEVFAQAAAAAIASKESAIVGNIEEETTSTSSEGDSSNVPCPIAQQQQQQQQQQHQQRVRKVSWIANPTAVDKLLTLFHKPTTIFQRSSSPESKTSTLTTTTGTQLSQSPPSSFTDASTAIQQQQQHQQQQMLQKCLVPMRKQSPPSWTKLGNDIIQAAGSNNTDLANAVATTAAAVVTEQSRSFLDAASKQFRDFSKQVFRQNLSFGNEPVTTATTSASMITTASGLNVPQTAAGESGNSILLPVGGEFCGTGCCGVATGCSCVFLMSSSTPSSNAECNADCIPTEVKQEIKENISPEHTINEETLQTLQKLYGNNIVAGTAVGPPPPLPSIDFSDDLMDLRDCSTIMTTPQSQTPLSTLQHQQQQQPPPPPTASLTTSGVENELPAHNT